MSRTRKIRRNVSPNRRQLTNRSRRKIGDNAVPVTPITSCDPYTVTIATGSKTPKRNGGKE